MSFERIRGRYRRADTRTGDTLQRVAARELGDAARWVELVSINRLLPPYLTDNLGEVSARVLLAGGYILVPDLGAGAATSVSDVDDAKTFGTDIALVNGKLLADENGDLATVAGSANLAQALRLRLNTDLGELVFHTDYGNGALALKGKGARAGHAQLAAALVKRCVGADPRISSTRDVTATLTGDRTDVVGTVVAIDGQRIPVES